MCCSRLPVYYFATKRGLITFCRIMLNDMLKLTTKETVHMLFYSYFLTFIQTDFLPHAPFVPFIVFCCYMHMNGILMTCLPLVTERLHICLSRDMDVCVMTAFYSDGTYIADVGFIHMC